MKKVKNKSINLNIEQLKNNSPNLNNSFYYYEKEKDIKTTYILSKRTKKGIYYYCSKKRNKCPGSIIFTIGKKEWSVLNPGSKEVVYDTCIFEDFYKRYLENNFTTFNMNLGKFQNY